MVVRDFDPAAYGPVFADAIGEEPLAPLDAGRPDRARRDALDALTVDSAFAGCTVSDHEAAVCCLAAVWLLHGYLDESHTLSQSVPSPSGSYWHGVMHRREGDHGNADYWFRRAGEHPAGPAIATAAAQHAETAEAAVGGAWDPHRFNALVREAKRAGGALEAACLEAQRAEWRALFDHCHRAAIA